MSEDQASRAKTLAEPPSHRTGCINRVRMPEKWARGSHHHDKSAGQSHHGPTVEFWQPFVLVTSSKTP